MIHPAGAVPADLSASASSPRPLRALLCALSFLLAGAAGCLLLGKWAPFPEVPGIAPKLGSFRAQRDDVDVLFLGSSRFFHQIIPAQFDAALAAQGVRVRSFNFGYDGMWPPESFYVLRQILQLRPARLRWVLIDLMDIETKLDARNYSTRRMAYWHDFQHTALAFRDILSSRYPWWRQAQFLHDHARLCAQQVLNLGRGAEPLARLLDPRAARRRTLRWEAQAGFDPGPETGLAGAVRQDFLARVEALRRDARPRPVRPVFRDALRAIIADVRRAGAEPIFVLSPSLNAFENFSEIPDGAAVLPLHRPETHPPLFDPDTHYDPWHLNPRGAVAFTALLARAFREHLPPAP